MITRKRKWIIGGGLLALAVIGLTGAGTNRDPRAGRPTEAEPVSLLQGPSKERPHSSSPPDPHLDPDSEGLGDWLLDGTGEKALHDKKEPHTHPEEEDSPGPNPESTGGDGS